jgi:hypothetical protein
MIELSNSITTSGMFWPVITILCFSVSILIVLTFYVRSVFYERWKRKYENVNRIFKWNIPGQFCNMIDNDIDFEKCLDSKFGIFYHRRIQCKGCGSYHTEITDTGDDWYQVVCHKCMDIYVDGELYKRPYLKLK